MWPDLPRTGFISGRAASVDDVKIGNAVFSMNGQAQYVFGLMIRVIKHPITLVQAEKAPDNSGIVGLYDLNGKETAATLPEVALLGIKKQI